MSELESLRRENELLRNKVARLERETEAMRSLVQQVKQLKMWDFSPYGVRPDDNWVAIDRKAAADLLAALAAVDHWDPWSTRIEPRPQA